MNRIRILSILTALFLLPLASPLQGRQVHEPELRVFLLTMDQGDAVWEKFGHNAIWIRDRAAGTDKVYNYGVFDFESPGYWSRFVKGDWIYQLAASDIYNTLRQYQYLNRTVTAQELNLSQAQARELQEFLEWNLRPENAEYLYDYYRDNCSTRVRDALDSVLGGAIRRATAEQPSGTTYRWHSRRLLQGSIAPYTGLALGLGPDADEEISVWEEMFLPGVLRERVREIEIPGPDGELIPLVGDEGLLIDAVGRPAEATEPSSLLGRFLLAGLGVGALILGAALLGGRVGIAGGVGRTLFALTSAAASLLIGGAGLLLAVLWGLTNHTIAHYNENLFHATPLALPLVVLLPALAARRRWAERPAVWFAVAVAASSIVGAVLGLLPPFSQANGEMIALLLPIDLAIALAAVSLRRSSHSPRDDISEDQPEYRRSAAGGR